MKIILIEDDEFKAKQMTIPSFEISPEHPSSRTRKYGGKDILSEIERCEIDLPSIIVTQYRVFDDGEVSLEKIDMELTQEFNQIYYGIVYYNSSTMDWQDKLIDLIENIQK